MHFPPYVEHWLKVIEPLAPWLMGLGVLMALVSMIAIPWLIIDMPEDYFVAPADRHHPHRGLMAWTVWTVRNTLALLLILAGIAMLVLPGQGLLTILIGIMSSNFPGKYRLERALIRQDAIFHAVNWIRERGHKPPILHPEEPDPTTRSGDNNND